MKKMVCIIFGSAIYLYLICISKTSVNCLGFLYVDGRGPFTTESPGRSNGLDLEEPLYIGGVPDYNQLPDDIIVKQG